MTEIPRLARVLAKQILGDPAYVDRLSDYDLRFYAEGVRTILREIREPTTIMKGAPDRAGRRPANWANGDGWEAFTTDIFQSMIDELLK